MGPPLATPLFNVENIASTCNSAVSMRRDGRNMRAQNCKTDARASSRTAMDNVIVSEMSTVIGVSDRPNNN